MVFVCVFLFSRDGMEWQASGERRKKEVEDNIQKTKDKLNERI
jgi:hypothetical protein